MAKIIYFQDHVRESSSLRAARSAKTSSVTPGTSSSDANATTAAQCPAGIPRTRQLLTVESDFPSATATAPVPPRATIIVSELSMPDNIIRKMRTCQEQAKSETTFRNDYVAIHIMASDNHSVARRLIAVREKLGFADQSAYARELNLTKSTYNAFETGKRPLSIRAAKQIRHRFGISVDYLLFGDIGQPNEMIALGTWAEP